MFSVHYFVKLLQRPKKEDRGRVRVEDSLKLEDQACNCWEPDRRELTHSNILINKGTSK